LRSATEHDRLLIKKTLELGSTKLVGEALHSDVATRRELGFKDSSEPKAIQRAAIRAIQRTMERSEWEQQESV
jgi:hypothetical protein